MKMLVPLLFFIVIGASAQQRKHPAPAKATMLRIEAWELGRDQEFRVTIDSIIVIKITRGTGGEKRIRYARFITNSERDNLLAPFSKIYLSSLKSSYYDGRAATDAMSFRLYIYKGEVVTRVEIYKYKFLPFYLFSKNLNSLLPLKFKIEYNNQYINR